MAPLELDDDEEPPEIEGYVFAKRLGLGGYAHVYLYEQLQPRIRVAVKIPKLGVLKHTELVQFAAEAEAMAAVADHPYIVPIYKVGRLRDGRPYLVMKYYPPPNLGQRVSSERLRTADAIQMGIQIASAVETAHREGIIHRDIKPANILISQYGDPGLTDFGTAGHIADVNDDSDDVGLSIPWAAPEILRGTSNGSVLSDIYSLGATLWHLLAGRSPFEVEGGDNSPRALVGRILSGYAPATGRRDVPHFLDRLLQQALARDPGMRPRTALEFAQSLQAIQQEQRLGRTEIVVEQVNGPTSADGPSSSAPSSVTESFRQTDWLGGPSSAPSSLPNTISRESLLRPESVTREDSLTTLAPTGDDRSQVSTESADIARASSEQDRDDPAVVLRNRYILLEPLASGQSGTLHKAFDKRRGGFVAVKMLVTSDQDVHFRLARGGRVWLNLSHPRIVQVFDVVDSSREGPAFIVSQFIEGQNLATYLENHDMSAYDAINLVGELCDALAYLHGRGIVHREINQRNIMLSPDRPPVVTLLDSGIARQVNPEVDHYTKTGVFVGDLAYAAPEQFSDERVTDRADIWAVAALLYDLVCSTPRPLDPAGDWQPQVEDIAHLPSGARRAIVKGLSSDVDQRYLSITDFQGELGIVAPQLRHVRNSVVALHGIRTRAAWQRALSEVGLDVGIATKLDRWNFGYFSLVRLVSPWSRAAKVRWFREVYQSEFPDLTARDLAPSIVAHSFGTYILGNALLRYPYLRFDKILLCGSILPQDFPWTHLIERGQVGEVRNEYGIEDIWTRLVGYIIPGTGQSGRQGFTIVSERIVQERFNYAHSEYFSRAHMISRWLPFLASPRRLTAQLSAAPIDRIRSRPVLLSLAYALVMAAIVLVVLIVAL